MKFTTKEVTLIGIFSTLILIATSINFVLPGLGNGMLVHLGTTVSLIVTLVFGRRIGMYSSAIGMALFDILGGWLLWFMGTFIARLGFCYIIGTISDKYKGSKKYVYLVSLAYVGASVWLIVIYYVWEVLLYGNFIVPFSSIPANLIQIIIAYIIGLPLSGIINKKVHRHL